MSISEQSREEVKETKKTEESSSRKIRIRLFPIWLRIVLLLFFMSIAAIGGAMIGYGVLGDGKPTGVFDKRTWQHVFDLVEKESEK
ncbi:DNA-directed RNA polymerase subunit beta [Bacillus sp. V2I10]|uniref:DNA-directed RNA polymerase subunit beta n=1 Tax=Bacillus sp. V2I10 TaxID=3042276 RepID=UPI0027866C36|nr:DNA-directed RNA polymerase subunit beta [Bacillus sp. V2I10]MDQ0857119.1 glucan phosphoethanolaminetransferase (alkaline phosphatase superfamily) [Bacillus sp. V2I10]